jgi:phenylacetate-coenzyme A ligase PaaK-like adenylate-forming protein
MDALQRQIKHIAENIPFYKNLKIEQDAEITDLPVINKPYIKNEYVNFLSETYPLRLELHNYLRSGNVVFPSEKIESSFEKVDESLMIEKTSGSSGIPFLCVKSMGERINLARTLWNMRKQIDPAVSYRNFFALAHPGRSKLPYSPYNLEKENIVKLYEFIRAENYRWIHIPHFLISKHIDLISEKAIAFADLKFIESSGSLVDPQVKKKIEDFFGAKVVDQYGTIETWPIKLFLNEDNVFMNDNSLLVELLDENNNPIKEQGKVGKVVVTTLLLKIMPFIRYDVGDFGFYQKNKNGMNYLSLIPERDFNFIKGYHIKESGIEFFRKIITSSSRIYNLTGLKYIQITQEKEYDHFTVEMNKFHNAGDLFNYIGHETRKVCYGVTFKCILLDESLINKKTFLKPYLFISKAT